MAWLTLGSGPDTGRVYFIFSVCGAASVRSDACTESWRDPPTQHTVLEFTGSQLVNAKMNSLENIHCCKNKYTPRKVPKGQAPGLLGKEAPQCPCLTCGDGSWARVWSVPQLMGPGSSFLSYKNRNSSQAIMGKDCTSPLCRAWRTLLYSQWHTGRILPK